MKKTLITTILALLIFQPVIVSAQGTNHRFTGQELDAESGLYNFNAREYNPNIGRFNQPDPLLNNLADPQKLQESTGQELQKFLENPQALNSYSYTVNNPVKYVDPTGEIPIIPIALGILSGIFLSDIRTAYAPTYNSTAPFVESKDFGDLVPGWNKLSKLGRFGIGLIFGGITSKLDSKVSNIVERLATKLDRDVAERIAGKVESGYITFYHGTKDTFEAINEGIKGIKGLHFTDDVSIANRYGLGWTGLDTIINGGTVQWKFSVNELINFVERGLIEVDPKDITGFRSFSKEVLDKVNKLIK